MPGYENDPKWTGWIDLHRADSWHHRLEKKKVDTVATSQRKAAAPKSEGTNDAIASALLPDIATGATMRIVIVFGGESETIDNIKQRVHKRYPNATVDIIDAKDDPTGMDITLRSVRKDILTRLKTDYDVAFFCLPCTTFTPRSGRQYRGKSGHEIRVMKNIPSEWKIKVKRHNIFIDFTHTAITYCEGHGIAWGVETRKQSAEGASELKSSQRLTRKNGIARRGPRSAQRYPQSRK